MNYFLFAHAGETHDDVAEAASHSVFDNPFIAIAALLLALAVVFALLRYIAKVSLPTTMNVLLGLLFVAGVLGYQFSSAISIFALTTGFALALGLTFIGAKQAAVKPKK